MDSKELREAVVSKFNAKKDEFDRLKGELEAFCVGILVDCKDVIEDIPDAKTLVNLIIDEIDDRTNTGLFDPVDGAIVKGIFAKYGDTDKLENWFYAMRTKALNVINANIPKNEA